MNSAVVCAGQTTPWTPLAPGIEMQIFHADEATGIWTVKILMHSGSTLPPHRHDGASEFYILSGNGTHKEAGDFEPGTYAFEPQDAVHSPVHAEDDILLYMTSYGPGTFTKPSGAVLYVGDAAYFKKQTELSPFMRAVKRFFFISVWSIFKGRG
jgi:quercetin dioxygenase-like cupin family protein